MSIYDKDCEEGCRLLRAEKDKIEAVKTWHKAQLGNKVDPQDIYELSKILEAEG